MEHWLFFVGLFLVSVLIVLFWWIKTDKFVFCNRFLQIVKLSGKRDDVFEKLTGRTTLLSDAFSIPVDLNENVTVYAFKDRLFKRYVCLKFDESDKFVKDKYYWLRAHGKLVSYLLLRDKFSIIAFINYDDAYEFFELYRTKRTRHEFNQEKVVEEVILNKFENL